MSFRLTEEHEMLGDAVRPRRRARLAPRAAEIDRTGEFPEDLDDSWRTTTSWPCRSRRSTAASAAIRNLGFSDVTLHDGERVRVVKATLIRRPDGTPHSVQLTIDRYQRARKYAPWPISPAEHVPLGEDAFDPAFAHMAAWREVLPAGRSTRYVTLLVDDEHPNTQGIHCRAQTTHAWVLPAAPQVDIAVSVNHNQMG